MKKLTAMILAAVMLASLAACGTVPTTTTETAGTTAKATGTTAEATESSAPDPLYAEEAGVKKICVSPSGDDSTANGTREHPYATIDAARLAVRNIDRTGLSRIDVIIAAGTYFTPQTVILRQEDCGDESCRIRYVGEDGAVITGGVSLTAADFSPVNETFKAYLKDEVKDKVVEIDLTKHGVTTDDVKFGELTSFSSIGMNSLFQGADRLTVARYPNEGFVTITSAKVRDDGDYTFNLMKTDYAPTKEWHDKENVYVDGYFAYYWAHDLSKVVSFSKTKNSITVKNDDHYEPVEGMCFFFYNIPEELDMPGEYYIDTDGMLYYYPNDGFETETLKYPVSNEMLFEVNGDYVTLENLTFENTMHNALNIYGNNNVMLNCTVQNIGSYGLDFIGSNNRLEGCTVRSVGYYGVGMSGGDTNTLTKANSIAVNNLVCNFAESKATYNGAFRIDGCGVTLSHCEIYGGPHLGISLGGNYNVIEYNDIHDLCQFTDDAGCIYTGRTYSCYGNVMRYNYFHDIGSNESAIIRMGGSGIYWDDGLGGQTAYGNVFENVKGSAYAIGGGPDHTVENNLFINCRTAISYDQRMWDGIFAGGWCKHNMGESIADRNYTEGAWAEAFPTLKQMNYDDAAGQPDDPWFYANPSRSVVRNNVAFSSETADTNQYGIAERVYMFSTVENCTEQTYADGAQPTVEEALAIAGSALDIPFSEIGLLTDR